MLCEATEQHHRWFTARLLCPTCEMRILREGPTPAGAENAVLEGMEDHLVLAHGVDGPPPSEGQRPPPREGGVSVLARLGDNPERPRVTEHVQ